MADRKKRDPVKAGGDRPERKILEHGDGYVLTEEVRQVRRKLTGDEARQALDDLVKAERALADAKDHGRALRNEAGDLVRSREGTVEALLDAIETGTREQAELAQVRTDHRSGKLTVSVRGEIVEERDLTSEERATPTLRHVESAREKTGTGKPPKKKVKK